MGTMTGRTLSLLGWLVLLLGLYMWSKTRTGYSVIYYSLVLVVLFLFVSNYQAVLNVMTVPEGGSANG